MKSHVSILSCLMVGLIVAAPVFAQDDVRGELDYLKKRVAELEKRLSAQENRTVPMPAYTGKNPSAAALDADIDAEFMNAGSGDQWFNKTSIGGYGEMHMNFNDDADDQIDFHRWVLFINHEFTDNIRLVSELELEHSLSGDGKNGEVELEQAYIEMGLGNGFTVKGGLFLTPIGILNEVHEPATFFGTERNLIEREIIPTTWWEGGLALTKTFEETGWQFDLAVHSGLNVPTVGGSAFRPRSGRQKVSQANANEWASTVRVRYTGIPGLEIASSVQYQSDITPDAAFSEKNDALLTEAHIDFRRGGFGLRALGAVWSVDGETPEALGLDEQWGYYIEPSYTFTFANGNKLGFFTRYSQMDGARGEITQWDAGVNYWPIDNVVFKADYSNVEVEGGDTSDSINLGIGYHF